jgi:mannitol-1-phosphate/altronate dehydrogenase
LSKGLIILPCELIFLNGKELKKCIYQYIELWQLGDEFKAWFEQACGVYCTLVDRIVPGYPKDTIDQIHERIGYKDNLVVKGEIFHLWVIEAPESVAAEFPADKAGLNVLFVPSEAPYHERKVTLLNGPHTVLSPVGYLAGLDTVKQCVQVLYKYMTEVCKRYLRLQPSMPVILHSSSLAVSRTSRQPSVVCLGARGWMAVKPGRAAISSSMRGLYFMVQLPRG